MLDDLQVKLPFAFIMIAAALWTMAVIYWCPRWLNQTAPQRLMVALLEGALCGLSWGGFVRIGYDLNLASGVLNGLLAGALWAGVAYYSRRRYQKLLRRYEHIPEEPSVILPPLALLLHQVAAGFWLAGSSFGS